MSLIRKVVSTLPLVLALGCGTNQKEGLELSLWADFNTNGTYEAGEDIGHIDNESINFGNNYVKVRLVYQGSKGEVKLSVLNNFPSKVMKDYMFQVQNGSTRLEDNSEFLVELNRKLQIPGDYTLVAKPIGSESSYSQKIKSAYTPDFFEQVENQKGWSDKNQPRRR